MIRQIRYFQSVVRNNSFSEAVVGCHISRSAISQQIQALERELGFYLLERKNRKFTLIPAGEYFYKKSLVLSADYERMCKEAGKLAKDDKATLVIKGQGYMPVEGGKGQKTLALPSAGFLCSGKFRILPETIVLFGSRKIQVTM